MVALEHKRRLVLGRDTGCDIVLDDRRVSRRHCEVRWEGDHATITDLGSNNGTYLGDVKLIPHQPERFRPGTGIRVPPYTIRLETVAPAPQPVAAATRHHHVQHTFHVVTLLRTCPTGVVSRIVILFDLCLLTCYKSNKIEPAGKKVYVFIVTTGIEERKGEIIFCEKLTTNSAVFRS